MIGKLFIIGTVFLLGSFGGGAFWLKKNYDSGKLQEKIIERALPTLKNSPMSMDIFRGALGMDKPRTYLVLLLNNTELRPGGGFIGAYAVARVDRGRPTILKVEGSEIIDNAAKAATTTPPPELAKYLGLKNWQFRDSNWSPDFPTDARRALEFYSKEGGLLADEVSGVIAATPDVFEEILGVIGPIKVGGIEFTRDNFTETLEYEVEYGFEKRGLEFHERKNLLGDLSSALLPRLFGSVLTHWGDYLKIILTMLDQKHIMLYSTLADEQTDILKQNWGGKMKESAGDYLLWADANLGALKTDVVIARSLSYSIAPSSSRFIATASMRYHHTGGITWRTSRYRDYARIFVPKGSKLVGSTGADDRVDEGDEGGRHWFGAFFSLNPGGEAELAFTYLLPENIKKDIEGRAYSLNVQKQPGTDRIRLTLELRFDKPLKGAAPAETPEKFGDDLYQMVSDLKTDREFNVNFH